jgi:hypothetical protein
VLDARYGRGQKSFSLLTSGAAHPRRGLADRSEHCQAVGACCGKLIDLISAFEALRKQATARAALTGALIEARSQSCRQRKLIQEAQAKYLDNLTNAWKGNRDNRGAADAASLDSI